MASLVNTPPRRSSSDGGLVSGFALAGGADPAYSALVGVEGWRPAGTAMCTSRIENDIDAPIDVRRRLAINCPCIDPPSQRLAIDCPCIDPPLQRRDLCAPMRFSEFFRGFTSCS